MFKPNIRGFPKSRLRLGLAGWRVQGEPDVRLDFRLPWVQSWPIRLAKAQNVEILFSRSGKAHLLRKSLGETAHQDGFEAKISHLEKTPKKVMIASAVCAIAAVAGLVIGGQTETSDTPENLASLRLNTFPQANDRIINQEPPLTCRKIFESPSGLIESWLAGGKDSRLVFSEGMLIQLGGVRSRLVTVKCSSSIAEFRVTESKTGSEWKMRDVGKLQP